MFMSELAMLVSRGCVLLGLVVLTEIVVMGRLMMMVRRRVVMSGGVGMMLTRRTFRSLWSEKTPRPEVAGREWEKIHCAGRGPAPQSFANTLAASRVTLPGLTPSLVRAGSASAVRPTPIAAVSPRHRSRRPPDAAL